jgi:hypothetical protein
MLRVGMGRWEAQAANGGHLNALWCSITRNPDSTAGRSTSHVGLISGKNIRNWLSRSHSVTPTSSGDLALEWLVLSAFFNMMVADVIALRLTSEDWVVRARNAVAELLAGQEVNTIALQKAKNLPVPAIATQLAVDEQASADRLETVAMPGVPLDEVDMSQMEGDIGVIDSSRPSIAEQYGFFDDDCMGTQPISQPFEQAPAAISGATPGMERLAMASPGMEPYRARGRGGGRGRGRPRGKGKDNKG